VSTRHEEFPKLTNEANAAYLAAFPDISDPLPVPVNRRCFAAFLREAIRQARKYYDHSSYLSLSELLEAIASNLHSPPPVLPAIPTKKQMDEILQDLNAAFGDQIGPEWTSDPFEALQRGIAHYCKDQP
jgi:hypothetical protein